MKFGIKHFAFAILSILIVGLYISFSNYFFLQREQTAKVITNNIKNDLSELSYVLSKHIRKEPVSTSRSILDRKAANNNYLNAIAIFDDDVLMVTTDQKFSEVLDSTDLFIDSGKNFYKTLQNKVAFEESISYYVGKDLKHYTLLFFIDHDFIAENFTQERERFLVLFLIIPLIVISVIWIIIQKTVISPLELLRQYAYYHTKIPNPFRIIELEHIRSSLVQTFFRLEKEKTELYNLSRTDSLSGLANRNYLQERMDQILEDSKRNSKEFALLFLDLDHFKSVNDSLGHDIGDELLRSVAHSIQDILRLNDVVARIGGDEFVIVLTHYRDDLELVEIIDRIQSKLMRPWKIKTFPINVTSSIGVTIYPKDGTDLVTLMKNADIAMYEAKAKGRRGYHFYTQELNQRTQEYIELTNTMRTALKENQYELYYQPQNRVQTGEIIGAEALIRWKNPEGGMISPSVFIPIAEHNGFIVELGKWILESAIKQKKQWENMGMDIKVSINIAAKQVQQDDFLQHIQALLEIYKVNTENIYLEITEYIFLHDSSSVLKIFNALKELGLKISLDDFGTGYSSLSYLKTFPIDVLKIDKTFLDDYDNEDGAIFIETIVKMAQTLKIKVVAEGVEEQAQVEYLKSLGCDLYQGYVCSQPIEVDDFTKVYKNA